MSERSFDCYEDHFISINWRLEWKWCCYRDHLLWLKGRFVSIGAVLTPLWSLKSTVSFSSDSTSSSYSFSASLSSILPLLSVPVADGCCISMPDFCCAGEMSWSPCSCFGVSTISSPGFALRRSLTLI